MLQQHQGHCCCSQKPRGQIVIWTHEQYLTGLTGSQLELNVHMHGLFIQGIQANLELRSVHCTGKDTNTEPRYPREPRKFIVASNTASQIEGQK